MCFRWSTVININTDDWGRQSNHSGQQTTLDATLTLSSQATANWRKLHTKTRIVTALSAPRQPEIPQTTIRKAKETKLSSSPWPGYRD